MKKIILNFFSIYNITNLVYVTVELAIKLKDYDRKCFKKSFKYP